MTGILDELRRFAYVTRGVAWRSIHNTIVNPAILLPSIIFPLFFLIAFAGGLSRIADAGPRTAASSRSIETEAAAISPAIASRGHRRAARPRADASAGVPF